MSIKKNILLLLAFGAAFVASVWMVSSIFGRSELVDGVISDIVHVSGQPMMSDTAHNADISVEYEHGGEKLSASMTVSEYKMAVGDTVKLYVDSENGEVVSTNKIASLVIVAFGAFISSLVLFINLVTKGSAFSFEA